jgi:PAS domain-containing protein
MHQDIDFETIVAHIAQVVIVLDPNLTIVWANRNAAEAAGRDPTGLKCYRIYQGRETPCDRCHTLKTFRSGEMIPNQSTVTFEDGSQRRFDGFTIVVGRDEQGEVSLVAEIAGEV